MMLGLDHTWPDPLRTFLANVEKDGTDVRALCFHALLADGAISKRDLAFYLFFQADE